MAENVKSLENAGNTEKTTIKQLREKTGLSQAKFGELYSIPLNTIKNWECDENKPNHRACPIYVLKLLERAVFEDFECFDGK